MRSAYLACFLAVALAIPASRSTAQTPEQQGAIGRSLRDYGGFVGLDTRFGDMLDDFAVFMGGHAALLLKHRVYLGVSGLGLITEESRASTQPAPGPAIDMGYGGLLVGYIVPTPSLVQITIDAMLGAGGVNLATAPGDSEEWDAVFVFEPTIGAEIKLARVARLGFGAGYRFIGGVDTPGLKDSDLRGITGTATFRLGWF